VLRSQRSITCRTTPRQLCTGHAGAALPPAAAPSAQLAVVCLPLLSADAQVRQAAAGSSSDGTFELVARKPASPAQPGRLAAKPSRPDELQVGGRAGLAGVLAAIGAVGDHGTQKWHLLLVWWLLFGMPHTNKQSWAATGWHASCHLASRAIWAPAVLSSTARASFQKPVLGYKPTETARMREAEESAGGPAGERGITAQPSKA